MECLDKRPHSCFEGEACFPQTVDCVLTNDKGDVAWISEMSRRLSDVLGSLIVDSMLAVETKRHVATVDDG